MALFILYTVGKMYRLSLLVFINILAVIAGSPTERIVGGTLTTIRQYPFAASAQAFMSNAWFQTCGASILNNRAVLSAAHCYIHRTANLLRFRVGSSYAHSGGVIHNTAVIVNHPDYNDRTIDNDIAVIRVTTPFNFGTNVRANSIAGATYNLADNQNVWAIGWGLMSWGGSPSEQLRQVQLRIVNQNTCRNVFSNLTPNMVCAGWPVDGRGICTRDSGGPLIHNGVVVGVTSFTATNCGLANFPGVFARVSRYTSWIQRHS